MAQLSDDCFAGAPALMPLAEALALIRARLSPVVGVETLGLGQALEFGQALELGGPLGRVLAEDIVADGDVPPHDNSAVDGYAFRFDDLAADGPTRLRVAGRAAAGHPHDGTVSAGAAIRIFTGAAMPGGCDSVVMQEDVTRERDRVIVPVGLKRGANRRRAGEDIAGGHIALRAGQRLRPVDLGIAASLGRHRLPVFKRLRVALFSTGDELREPDAALAPGQIHDSNRYLLGGLLAGLGAEVDDLGILADRRDDIRAGLAAAAADHHLIVTSGGVSVGDEDHVRAVVEDLGRLHFWRLAIKPGRPVALGRIGAALFAGLPGNPVAVVLTFARIIRPMIEILSGAEGRPLMTYRVRSGFDHGKKPGRLEWVRVRLERDRDGAPVAHAFARQGAGILTSVAASDGVLELPETMTRLEAGSMVDFLPFEGLIA